MIGDVARALQNAGSGALSARTDTLERRALVNVGSGDNQVVGAHTVVVLGVCHSGTENLLDVNGNVTIAELQDLESLGNGLVTDQIDHKASLAGGHAHPLSGSADLSSCRCHLTMNPPMLALWPRNVRVGANSPSL